MANSNWHSTLIFRNFRKQHTLLSRLYWTSELCRDFMKSSWNGKADTDFVVDLVKPAFKRAMLPESLKELLGSLDDRAGIERLHLLVICSANLETYLQDIARLYVAASGYQKSPRKLTAKGNALARPILQSSTIPDMIKYAQDLFEIKLESHLNRWQSAYKLRCAAAHNGGIVTAKVLRELPDQGFKRREDIRITWPQFRDYLESADEIVSSIDKAVSSKNLRELEAEWLLHEWKDDKCLPSKEDVWSELHYLGFRSIPAALKCRLEQEVYES